MLAVSEPPGVQFQGAHRRRGGARRRRGRHRGWSAALLVIVLLAGAGAALALTGTARDAVHRAPAPPGHSVQAPPGHSSRPPGRSPPVAGHEATLRARAAQRQSVREVNHVLAYTPFLVRGTPRHRVVALTFDDGPGPYTAAVVAILARMRVPATFFIVGQQLRYFGAGLRAELSHGFEIGDHTLNHAWLPRLGAAAQSSQISAAAGELQRLSVPRLLLFRPPYGAYDATTLRILHRLHMLMVMWSVDPSDWRRPGTKAIMRSVLAAARPGAVVILHDGGGDRSQTVAALPGIIRGLQRKHLQLVGLTRLLALDPPPHHQRLPSLGAR